MSQTDSFAETKKRWRAPHEECKENEHVFDCFCSVYDECADELERGPERLVRELVAKWRSEAEFTTTQRAIERKKCADELESALLGGE